MSDLSHVDDRGRARMVDISGKETTARRALARATVVLKPSTVAQIAAAESKRSEAQLPKGNALEAARLAGILAAKRTAELIPLCHPIPLGWVEVTIELADNLARIQAEVKTHAPTGAEMEALVAVSVAALTLYDMVKAVDPEAVITNVCVVEKSGGKSGHWRRGEVTG